MNYVKSLLIGTLALGMTGCGELKEPIRSEYKAESITITNPSNGQMNITSREVRDFNNSRRPIILINPSYGKPGISEYQLMNDRVRALSEQILKDQNELAYEIDKQLYDISIQTAKKTTQ